MSKLKVKVNLNNEIRLIEVDRRAPSFVALKNGIRSKYNLNSEPTLSYLVPNGTKISVKSDDDLRRAVFESGNSGHIAVEIDLHGVSRPAPARPQAAQQQQAQPTRAAQPAQQARPPQQQQAQPVKTPQTNTGVLLTFVVPGSGPQDKAKISPVPETTCYKFIPTPASVDTTVEVEIPTPYQLSFKLISSTAKLQQTFKMPFEITPRLLALQGTTVTLTFPKS